MDKPRVADRLDLEARSAVMARIGSRDTGPEIVVRKAAHRLGLRFRLHRRDLPGTPDLVFPARRAVVFVHGCFWHRHEGCKRASMPKSHVEKWQGKFERNLARDRRVADALQSGGWRVFVIWECETRVPTDLREKLRNWFNLAKSAAETSRQP